MSADPTTRLRERIDTLDAALVALLAERAALVAELWAHKQAAGTPLLDPTREAELRARLGVLADAAGLDRARVDAVFDQVVGVDLRAR